MSRSRSYWLPKLSLLVCLLTSHASLNGAACGLFNKPAEPGTRGGFAVPVKPASAQITSLQELSLEAARTRTPISAQCIPAGAASADPYAASALLAGASQPRHPRSAPLSLRSGRAPPSSRT